MKHDPCYRSPCQPSVVDAAMYRLWLPSRDRVEVLTSDIFGDWKGKFSSPMTGYEMVSGNEGIAVFFFGTC